MNPLEFSWKEDQQVTVQNPTDKAYDFKVHNKDYRVGAGKTVKMPGYIAWVYVYGISTQLAQAAGEFERWNEEGFRQSYYEKVVKGVDAQVQEVEAEPEEPAVSSFDEVDNAELPSTEPSQPAAPAEPATPVEQPAPNAADLAKVQPMSAKKSGQPAKAAQA